MPFASACMNAAVCLGASNRKHFTQCRLRTGNDHYHAFTAEDLYLFRQNELSLTRQLGSGVPDIDSQSKAVTNAVDLYITLKI